MNSAAITSFLAAPCVPRIHTSDPVLDTIQTLLDRHACGTSGPKLMRLVRKLRRTLLSRFRDDDTRYTHLGHPSSEGWISVHARLMYEFDRHASAVDRSGMLSARFVEFLSDWLPNYLSTAQISSPTGMPTPSADHRLRDPS